MGAGAGTRITHWVSTASRDALRVNAYQSIGRLWATATAMQPFGSRYFPSPSHMTVSPVGSVQTYSCTGAESGLRIMTSRLSTLQVDRSGSLTMTSDRREPEAINVPFYSSRVRIGMGFIGQRPTRSPWPFTVSTAYAVRHIRHVVEGHPGIRSEQEKAPHLWGACRPAGRFGHLNCCSVLGLEIERYYHATRRITCKNDCSILT